jgi:PAS domain S-box-containing protein
MIDEPSKSLLSNLPDITHEPRFRVSVLANTEIVPNVIILSLKRPSAFDFTQGQYVWLILPKRSEQLGVIDRKAYSISSGVQSDTLDFLIHITNSEYVSELKMLKYGDEIDIIGPMGSAFIPSDKGAIMISGGTGIAPFLSILRSKTTGDFSLLAYFSRERPLHNKQELLDLSNKYGYKIFLSEDKPKDSDFDSFIKITGGKSIFISGPQGFVDFVASLLVKLGIKSEEMFFEANYPNNEENKRNRNMLIDLMGVYSDRIKPGKSEKEFSKIDDLFFQVSKQTSNHVILTDHNGIILFANNAAEQMTGYTFNEMMGQTARLWGGIMPISFYKKQFWFSLKNGIAVKKPVINRRRDGNLYTAITTITPILQGGIIIAYVATEENITTMREVDRAKTEFVSLASHQLRTPLTTIRWYSEMILNGDTGEINDKQKKFLEEINKGNQRMVDLVDALLNVSRIEMGTFVIEPVLTDLKELAKSVLDDLKPQIQKKSTIIKENYDGSIGKINIDPKMMRIVLLNLLSNAVKYTPEKGTVTVSIEKKDKDILIKVADTGYGIPLSSQPKIFTKLYRADNAREKDPDGNGLGLYIVKSVMDNSGGKVWFESQEGKGTTFYVTLPETGMKSKTGTKQLT